jgi:dipeptidase D
VKEPSRRESGHIDATLSIRKEISMGNPTDRILKYFEDINTIPRCSGHESALAQWLKAWADQRSFAWREDSVGNLVIRVPASGGQTWAPTIILQGHMDMVCEKNQDSTHDFLRDPIRSHHDGDWLKAQGTSLGADNGLAIAYALARADDATIKKPPLELLFTVDEETGLSGVMRMGTDLITGKILINIDSEDEGVFTIGCSGGREVRFSLGLEIEARQNNWGRYSLTVSGLTGGHSGLDINKFRGNANKLMARVLSRIAEEVPEMRLESFSGGTRKNAIARDARAAIAVPMVSTALLENAYASVIETLRSEHAITEAKLLITLQQIPSNGDRVFGRAATQRLIRLLLALPHGVQGMSAAYPEIVESSCNLAIVTAERGKANIVVSVRSSVASRMAEMIAQLRAISQLAGVEFLEPQGYPPWVPQANSPLLTRALKVYSDLFGIEPKVKMIHAGLECAVIGGLYPGMEMLSIGPTIRNAHSPNEQLFIPSIERVWRLLVGILESCCVS